MLGFPLGILSAAGAAVVDTGAYELISSTILGGTAASVTFSNLGDYSSTYKHLQIRATMRSTTTFASGYRDTVNVVFNGDGGANYSNHYLWGYGSGIESGAGANFTYMFIPDPMPGNGGATSNFGTYVIDVLDAYSTTKNKTMRALGGFADPNWKTITLASGAWRSNSSLTSVLLKSQSGNTLAGSRFSLYGIKG
jgi:hypothetical protein